MPRNKDLKRLTRARMQKTGESYTTARSRLLEKRDRSGSVDSSQDFADLAGMSDAAVEKATGCTWERWVRTLDAADAASKPHREIAEYVHEKFDVSGWWAQTVTVGYERIRGLREISQRRDGSYEANKSRTVPVGIEELYRAFSDARTRARWLPDVELTIRKATPEKSMRITWPDGSPVEIYFTSKGEAKSQVAIQHRKLSSKTEVARVKEYWSGRLAELGGLLASA